LPLFMFLTEWLPQYKWNSVESGIKHHNPNPIYVFQNVSTKYLENKSF
jgi:hypothetical protein